MYCAKHVHITLYIEENTSQNHAGLKVGNENGYLSPDWKSDIFVTFMKFNDSIHSLSTWKIYNTHEQGRDLNFKIK